MATTEDDAALKMLNGLIYALLIIAIAAVLCIYMQPW